MPKHRPRAVIQPPSRVHLCRAANHLPNTLGESRRAAFTKAFTRYVDLYLAHMHLEEQEILPAAVKHLSAEDWKALDAAFEANRDPLTGHHAPEKDYERLFSRIVMAAPAPIGLG